jgi:glycosyltransferase involved in cell wall biosynthesis
MSLDKPVTLANYFDCVVMLTWSNWMTEPRSNRYHYASRFAQHLPVIFVQPDLEKPKVVFETTEIDNLVILHVYAKYGHKQTALINKGLLERGLIRPLLWVYNVFFYDFIAQRYAPLAVYHATEDYFSLEIGAADEICESLTWVLKSIDLLVGVSSRVVSSYQKNGNYQGKALLLENGCDFSFWSPSSDEIKQITTKKLSMKVALYQGGINNRLDLDLLTEICKALPDWEIWMCGAMAPGFDQKRVNPEQLMNLKNFGLLSPEKVRELSYQATVGIIPFVQNEAIRNSLPLKAFEYVACGLPVVSVSIPALEKYAEIFTFADNPQEFSQVITEVAETRYNEECIKKRLETAREQDYDSRFATLLDEIDAIMISGKRSDKQFNILVLYDVNSIHVSTIKEHLISFAKYSDSKVFYTSATHDAVCTIDLSIFDAIVIHYCVRVSLEDHLSSSYAHAVREFGGYKILFIQDEYDTMETSRHWMDRLGIHAIFTCVPEEYFDEVYPRSRFPYLERIRTLTGFVPIGIENHTPKPISERQIVIGYRGRPLPFYYGDLGREKVVIAQRMKQICQERNIPEDIEWSHEKRIYGDQWYPFVESSKATLGTETGSNVFDDHGEIKRNVERALAKNPTLSYEEIHARYIGSHEGKIKVNQISPRVFEAIALRTALVLFEGDYSNIIQPNVHYIPLKKDFSNLEDVLAKLADDNYLQELTDRAYEDLILSNKYSYQQFIRDFDSFLLRRLVKRNHNYPILGLLGIYVPQKKMTQFITNNSSTVSLFPLTGTELNTRPVSRSWVYSVFCYLNHRVKKYYKLITRPLQKYFKGTYVS